MTNQIEVQTTVKAPMATVWQAWNSAEGIRHWAFADDSWGAESLHNDLRLGGRFVTKMFAKDSGQGFDFSGQYDEVVENSLLVYTLDDGRKVRVEFEQDGEVVKVRQWLQSEQQNEIDYQRAGWQAFLDNFKKYVGHSKI